MSSSPALFSFTSVAILNHNGPQPPPARFPLLGKDFTSSLCVTASYTYREKRQLLLVRLDEYISKCLLLPVFGEENVWFVSFIA